MIKKYNLNFVSLKETFKLNEEKFKCSNFGQNKF